MATHSVTYKQTKQAFTP